MPGPGCSGPNGIAAPGFRVRSPGAIVKSMKPTVLAATLAVLLAGCQQSVHYAESEGYVRAARGVWPLSMEGPFPDPFRNEDAERLHEAITARTGIRPESFPEFRSYFLAAARELERNRAAASVSGAGAAEFERGLPATEALAIVRGYLDALAKDGSTRRFWIGGEPRRAFDRLLDHDDPQPVSAAPTPLEAPRSPGGTVLCWAYTVRCRVADVHGREAGQRFVFYVTGVAGAAGIYEVRAAS